VLYRSYANRLELTRRDTRGAAEEQHLSVPPGVKFLQDWSRDGRFVVYSDGDLWTLPITLEGTPTGEPKPYLVTPFNEAMARLSPEPSPHWIAYASDESGRFEIYVNSFPEPQGRIQISNGGGRFPEWGAGGHELFYATPDFKLIAVSLKFTENSIEPATPRELFRLHSMDLASIIPPYDTAADGQRFLVRVAPQQLINVLLNWPALLKKGPVGP
jgi:hypothetical protein